MEALARHSRIMRDNDNMNQSYLAIMFSKNVNKHKYKEKFTGNWDHINKK